MLFITVQVPLGILLKNENKGSEMIEILTHLHQYVPLKEFTKEMFIPSIEKVVTKQETVQVISYLVGIN